MKIGIITGEYPPMQGGVGAYTRLLAHELTRQGHSVSLFSTQSAQEETLPLMNEVTGWGLSSLLAIKKWAQAQRLDILNLQFQTAAYQMSPWIHFLPDFIRHIPVVTTFHDLRFPYLFPKAGPLRNWIVMHLARSSAGVIVTNHEDMAQLQHLSRVTMIPIGSNILHRPSADFDAMWWREKAGIVDADMVLAYFGMINRSKGVDVLFRSLAALRGGLNVHLLMIGSRVGTSDRTNQGFALEIDELIADLGLADCVHWTGFVSEQEVSCYLRCADAVVLPFLDGASFRRGSLMAAVYTGCPIITTEAVVSIPEFVHGENMLLVQVGDSAVLARAISNFYADMSHLSQSLREGALRLASRFEWSLVSNDYAKFFAGLL